MAYCMNTQAKKELAFLLGIGSILSLALRKKDLSRGLGLGAAILAISNFKKKPDSFKNKVVVITGGSRGLGLALARRFAIEGARVALLARDTKELERAKHILETHTRSSHILLCNCDITDDDQLSMAIGNVISLFGEIDVLVNNAGAIIVGPFGSMEMQDFEAQMKLHLYANISATKKVLPHFRRRKNGRIINICSMGGKVAVPHMLPYDTSKFALAGFSQGLTSELAMENISVTQSGPGLFRHGYL